VLEIGTGDQAEFAYKRMPMFKNVEEAIRYEELYLDYLELLEQIGLREFASDIARLPEENGRVVVYIAQKKLPTTSIGHKVIHAISEIEVKRLFLAVLKEMDKVFSFNARNKGQIEIGFDGQISNWAVVDWSPTHNRLPETIELIYFDTSTPLIRKKGVEQLDPELFLRSAPSFLLWIIRLFLLEEVMTRYYDRRRVTMDLIANFYKEQRPELIPDLVDTANGFFVQADLEPFKPLTVDEIQAYYKEDARIWKIYLAFRRIDRWLHNLMGKEYPYVLPGKIRR